MKPLECRHCGESDITLLVKNHRVSSGYSRECIVCKRRIAKEYSAQKRKKKIQSKKRADRVSTDLITHHVPCRNGCQATISVKMWPGVKPSKYHYCKACKDKDAGLSLQGIYN